MCKRLKQLRKINRSDKELPSWESRGLTGTPSSSDSFHSFAQYLEKPLLLVYQVFFLLQVYLAGEGLSFVCVQLLGEVS